MAIVARKRLAVRHGLGDSTGTALDIWSWFSGPSPSIPDVILGTDDGTYGNYSSTWGDLLTNATTGQMSQSQMDALNAANAQTMARAGMSSSQVQQALQQTQNYLQQTGQTPWSTSTWVLIAVVATLAVMAVAKR